MMPRMQIGPPKPAKPDTRLDYAPRPAWHRRRRFRRWAAALVVLVGVACALYWRVPLQQWSSRAYQQYQCMNYHLPAGTVAYEESPEAATALVAKGGEYAAGKTGGNFNTTVAIHVPAPLKILSELTDPPLRLRGATLFLHGRTSPGGNRRLVIIQRVPNTLVPAFVPYTDLDVTLLEPSWKTGLPRQVFPASGEPPRVIIPHDLNAMARHLRIFAGQPDPKDASHFMIQYEVSGIRGTIDGWLQDDDTVRMDVREGPAAQQRASIRERSSSAGRESHR
jgi:hypothetical protein